MEKLYILNTPFSYYGVEDAIHPVVLKDDAHMVLVDCGHVGQLPALEQAMQAAGLSCGDLTHVFVTHQDHDHVGALYDLKQKYPHVQVAASREEAPYISGKRKSLRLEQAEALQSTLPQEQQAFGRAFCKLLENVLPVPVDIEAQDGDILPWCGGCVVVATPGHTPGHVSLYVKRENTMIAGDAAALQNGMPVVANPEYALNLSEAEASLRRLIESGAARIICYHGGEYDLPKGTE